MGTSPSGPRDVVSRLSSHDLVREQAPFFPQRCHAIRVIVLHEVDAGAHSEPLHERCVERSQQLSNDIHMRESRIEPRVVPPRLDLENYPHLPLAEVQITQAADYMTLLSAPTITTTETSVGEVAR
jgi:hypothetical protein